MEESELASERLSEIRETKPSLITPHVSNTPCDDSSLRLKARLFQDATAIASKRCLRENRLGDQSDYRQSSSATIHLFISVLLVGLAQSCLTRHELMKAAYFYVEQSGLRLA